MDEHGYLAVKELRRAEKELEEVEEVLRRSYEDLDRYPVPEYLESSYGIGSVNMAVTGGSGVGKSSFINAVRRLKPRDPSAARTGVNETTAAPQRFEFCPGRTGVLRRAFDGVGRLLRGLGADFGAAEEPIQRGDRLLLQGLSDDINGQSAEVVSEGWETELQVRLDDGRRLKVTRDKVTGVLAQCIIWDLPGVGTRSFPQASYLRNMGIRHFDLVVLMTASRFTEAELMLMEELRVWKVPFFLVRSKVDASIESEIEDSGEACELGDGSEAAARVEAETVKTIKDFFSSQHQQDKIYCISARPKYRTRFDFLELEQDMQEAVKAQRVVDDLAVQPLGQLFAT